MHLTIAEQVERGYVEKSGQWYDNEYLYERCGDYTIITFRGTEYIKLSGLERLPGKNILSIKRRFQRLGVFLEKAKSMIADVSTDLRAYPARDSRVGWGHAGFLKAARGIVDHELSKYNLIGQKVILGGHSLGGAIAREAAQFLLHKGINVVEVVDFGAPRSHIGRPRYVCKMTSYKYGDDIVTDVPFGLIWDYKHPYEVKEGTLIRIGSEPTGRANSSHHSMRGYTRALKDFLL